MSKSSQTEQKFIKVTNRKLSWHIRPKSKEEAIKEQNLFSGSIWGVEDYRVPFDFKRKPDHLKDSLRPALVHSTPVSFYSDDFVLLIPGTSKPHKLENDIFLFVQSQNTRLKKDTYFLFNYSWEIKQKYVINKFDILNNEDRIKFDRIIERL